MKVRYFVFLVAFILQGTLYAQKKTPKNWQLLSPAKDKIYGMAVEEAYVLMKDRKPDTVIVAVIDCGVDIEHPDLKNIIWTNKGEIPDNGIDDDKNGYIDDVNGWSFLGGKTDDINYEAFEIARLYRIESAKYKSVKKSEMSSGEHKEYNDFKKLEKEYLQEQRKYEGQLFTYQLFDDFIKSVKKSSNDVFSKKTLKKYKPKDKLEKKIRKRLKLMLLLGSDGEKLEKEFSETRVMFENMIMLNTSNADSIRQAIVGDDPYDTINRYYGCNRVKGPDASHGTHVAGIIAAVRGNNIGMDGIANNVLIMPVRAVPNGDERDKDVANAIRYAVDNGASVVNMSFGKYYSPNKGMIDEAVKYAESKDVLLIHAAGNESKDSDTSLSFPNRELLNGQIAKNWIQVGANAYKPGEKMIAEFSNYGLTRVDLFAPGVDIYSTMPENQYEQMSGTSMASPSVAGAAAVIRGYFPELKANEVRELLMKTVVYYDKPVKVPGNKKLKKKVKEMCISGGFINLKAAVQEQLKKEAK